MLKTLAAVLVNADSEAMDNAELMYSAKFRCSEPFLASALDSEDFDALNYDLKVITYVIPQIGPEPKINWNDDDYDSLYAQQDAEYANDLWNARAEDILENAPDILVPSSLVVALCNYKGEGEGFALFDNAKSFSMFYSKSASADYFNC